MRAGEIRTAHTLRTLRRHVDIFRKGCGFWPNCTGATTVLPKTCWGRLAEDADACGADEPTLRVQYKALQHRAAQRSAKQQQQPPSAESGGLRGAGGPPTFTLSASGPVPTVALDVGADSQLCLTTWRAQLADGMALGHTQFTNPHRAPSLGALLTQCTVCCSTGVAAVFVRCPHGKHGHQGRRATAQVAVEWIITQAGSRRGDTQGLHVSPRGAPHLCLTAPPIAHAK